MDNTLETLGGVSLRWFSFVSHPNLRNLRALATRHACRRGLRCSGTASASWQQVSHKLGVKMKAILLAAIVRVGCNVRGSGQNPWPRQDASMEASKRAGSSCADHLLNHGHWAYSGSSSERHLDTGWSWKAPRREHDGCELLEPNAARHALRGRWIVDFRAPRTRAMACSPGPGPKLTSS